MTKRSDDEMKSQYRFEPPDVARPCSQQQPPMKDSFCTLDAAAIGQRVRVVRLDGEDDTCQRLQDLGFWPGTEVDVLHRAPWFDPTLYAVRGQRLALRRAEAARVQIEIV